MLVTAKNTSAEQVISQAGRPGLDFLVISNDYSLFKSVAAAIRQVNGRLICAPAMASARDYICRRKVDGIVVDMNLPGAIDMVKRVRAGSTNKGSVIFACMNALAETQCAIREGANFVLHRPLHADKIAHIFALAKPMMASEKRRCYRHPLMVPVNVTLNGREAESTMSNLSEGGMAIWSLHYHPPGSSIQFEFELPFGPRIQGKGEVAWTSPEGLAGVKFHILPDQIYTHLSEWMTLRESKPS